MSQARDIDVKVELPVHLVPGADRDVDREEELRPLWIVQQVRRGRIGVGRGAELARLDRMTCSRLLAEHGVPVFELDDEDLAAELSTLEHLGR